MKIKLLVCCLLVLLFTLPLTAAPPKGKTSNYAQTIENTTWIDANKILMFVTNHGNFGRDLSDYFGYDYGTFYPYAGDPDPIADGVADAVRSPLYAAGLWAGGRDSATNEVRVIISEYNDEYVPGNMEGGTFVPDNPDFKIFKMTPNMDPTSQMYLDYMSIAVPLGAPTKEVNGETVPDITGSQMLWAVYNDANPAQHTNNSGETNPMGIEVRQSTFGFDREDALGEIVFLKWQIFNKGGNTLQDCYFSVWSDPDLGGSGDDLVGIDTLLSLGFCYNANNNDQYYASTPPAIGFDFFQGPKVFTGDDADTAKEFGTYWPQYKTLPAASFNKYINGTDPDNFGETYNYMRGLQADGNPYEYNGTELLFQVSGDPVAGTGDLDIAPDDRRMMISTGPITFRPGDSTEIVAAIVVAMGGDRLSSISLLKYYDEFAQAAYDADFVVPDPPASPIVTINQLDQTIVLNWTDTSEVDHGTYDFQGYTIYQGESSTGPWTRIANYDVVDGVALILDDVYNVDVGSLENVVVKKGSDNGLTHYYIIDEDKLLGGDLNNVSEYYFRVEAYSYDANALPKTLTSANKTPIAVRPRGPLAGFSSMYDVADTLFATHSEGTGDGSAFALILNPYDLTGDDYRVTFDMDGMGAIFWTLANTSTGDTLLTDQYNQSGDDTYIPLDGFVLKVNGPPLEGKSYAYASASPANLSPVATAEDPEYTGGRWFTGGQHGGELFFGGVFMEPNFWGLTSLAVDEYPIVELRFRPMASYTDLNGDGSYTIGEPYVVDDPGETQGAFMYTGFSAGAYEGFFNVPFTAWDVTDPANPRQLNVAVRDRDGNHQWDLHILHDPATTDTTGLPRSGDIQFNYCWILNTTYDPTGTYYGDGTGGTVDFWSYDGGAGVWDAAWTLWVDDRHNGGMLAEECTFTLTPNFVNSSADVFTFTPEAATQVTAEASLDDIKAVPNPFYLYGSYDPSPGSKRLAFHHLPATCTIRIYNIAGDLIRTIEKDDASTPIAFWDMLTDRQLPIASGIYVYVVDAPGYGHKVGKVAVFTETEVLKIY
ncbi:MAG: hypothetical protein R3F48_17790 [Candidatus Zixiibacteriota bacterium]